MLCHHVTADHHAVFLTTKAGSFSIQDTRSQMDPIKRKYALAIQAFVGSDTVSGINTFNSGKLLEVLCDAPPIIHQQLDVFLDPSSSNDQICKAGRNLFSYMYGAPSLSLSEIRYNMYSKQTSSGVLSPEKLPPTEGSSDEHSLRAYLQLQDWIVLKSMSRDPTKYGFAYDSTHGYQPVTTKQEWAPKYIRDLTKCNCRSGCKNRKCGCVSNNVPCIAACGQCNGLTCNNTKGNLMR